MGRRGSWCLSRRSSKNSKIRYPLNNWKEAVKCLFFSCHTGSLWYFLADRGDRLWRRGAFSSFCPQGGAGQRRPGLARACVALQLASVPRCEVPALPSLPHTRSAQDPLVTGEKWPVATCASGRQLDGKVRTRKSVQPGALPPPAPACSPACCRSPGLVFRAHPGFPPSSPEPHQPIASREAVAQPVRRTPFS